MERAMTMMNLSGASVPTSTPGMVVEILKSPELAVVIVFSLVGLLATMWVTLSSSLPPDVGTVAALLS
jgi:hypothetical protein